MFGLPRGVGQGVQVGVAAVHRTGWEGQVARVAECLPRHAGTRTVRVAARKLVPDCLDMNLR